MVTVGVNWLTPSLYSTAAQLQLQYCEIQFDNFSSQLDHCGRSWSMNGEFLFATRDAVWLLIAGQLTAASTALERDDDTGPVIFR